LLKYVRINVIVTRQLNLKIVYTFVFNRTFENLYSIVQIVAEYINIIEAKTRTNLNK